MPKHYPNPKEVEMYVKSEKDYCPYCGTDESQDIYQDAFDRIEAVLRMLCDKCGAQWEVMYGEATDIYDV